jgi:hypothetical protein
MSLETTLTDITARLRQGKFLNEQAISQGIVLRVLQVLGWDIYDTTSVWPEFQTGEGRADFALCHPPSKPAEFVEVKPPGKAEDGVRQALEYAFHTGVPFIVRTDSRTCSFYLPAEPCPRSGGATGTSRGREQTWPRTPKPIHDTATRSRPAADEMNELINLPRRKRARALENLSRPRPDSLA